MLVVTDKQKAYAQFVNNKNVSLAILIVDYYYPNGISILTTLKGSNQLITEKRVFYPEH